MVSAQDRLARRVDVDVASHHSIIDPILADLRAELADLTPQPPSIPVFVTTGGRTGGRAFDAGHHWVDNLRNPVRFTQAVAAAGAQHAVFVEVSPHPLLSYAVDQSLEGVHHHARGTLQRDTNDTFTFHANLNATPRLRPPDLPHPGAPRLTLPATLAPTRHWLDVDAAAPEVDDCRHSVHRGFGGLVPRIDLAGPRPPGYRCRRRPGWCSARQGRPKNWPH